MSAKVFENNEYACLNKNEIENFLSVLIKIISSFNSIFLYDFR